MEANKPEKIKMPPRWGRRLLWTLAIFILLLGIFHRWIIFGLVSAGVRYAEKSAHLRITYELSGSIFTSFELSDLRIRAIEPGPLEKVTLQRLALRYHPWTALTQGLPGLIESIELRDLDLVLDTTEVLPAKKKKPKKKGSSKVAIPFPRLVDLRGIRVRIKTPTGLLEVDQANLTLLPEQPGVISVNRLVIPEVRTFENLHGETSYADRKLVLQNLTLDQELTIQRLQIDASKIGEQQLAVQLAASTFGGPLDVNLSLVGMDDDGDLQASVSARAVDLTKMIAFMQPLASARGKLDELNLQLAGKIADLSTWNGILQLAVSHPGFGKTNFDRASLHATLTSGQVKIADTVMLKGNQWIALQGTAQLPGPNAKTLPFRADIALSADLNDIAVFEPGASGSARLDLTVNASPTDLQATLISNLSALSMDNASIDSAQATAHFSKTSHGIIDWKQPWWNDTSINAELGTSAVLVNGYQIDRVGVKLISRNANANIDKIEIVRGQNSVRADGTFLLQEKPAGPLPGVLTLALQIDCPVLREFSVDPEMPVIEGRAQGTAAIQWETADPVADLKITASELLHQGVKLGDLNLAAHVETGLAVISDLHLDLPGESFIQATGEFDLRKGDRYAGQLSTRLTDLAQFKPLLGKSLAETPLSGTLQVDWSGTGQLKERLHEGRLSLFANNGVFSGVTGINLQTDGFYTPSEAGFPGISLTTSKGNLATSIKYANNVLRLDDLKLTQAEELRLAGNVALPLNLAEIANSEKRFPLDAPLEINLAGKDVQIGGLLVDLGLIPPATGMISLEMKASGTLRKLEAIVGLNLGNLEIEKAKQLQPISAQVNLAISNQRAQLSGTIQEASIQPITLSGSLPLDLASIISTGTISPDLPISAKVSLPPTPLAFLTRQVSLLKDVEGTAGLDVSVEGTLGKPLFLGGLKSDLKLIRFRGDALPTLRGIGIELNFRENVLKFSQFKGDLAGGPLVVSGKIDLTKPTAPIFDLALKGQSILVIRNDTMIVRSDLDLALKGPMASAELTGKVGIVDSRFFREIDILPINLPGRPAPAVEGKRPNVSITAPPVRDWKFNVNIATVDNFKISGNLANGDVVIGLNLGGTGLAPTLDGNVQIAQLQASLPFSRLNISNGNIYFSKDLPPLNPILDLQGQSKVRDYEIAAYIWGDVAKPQTLFLSQPPLSQEDILTLLATGVTQSEIAANPQLLAGRAGYLFIQKYYNKIFKNKRSFEQESFADRFDLQLGNTDPKTGRENVSARLKLSDHWQAIFDLDVSGGVRGQTRYLIRFK